MFKKLSELDEWNLEMEKCMAEGAAPADCLALALKVRALLAKTFPE